MACLTTTVSAHGSQSSSSAASASSPVTIATGTPNEPRYKALTAAAGTTRAGPTKGAEIKGLAGALGRGTPADLDEDGARVVRVTYDAGRMTRARVVADEQGHIPVAITRRFVHRQRLLAEDDSR